MNIKVFIRNNKREYINVCFRLRDTSFDLHYKSDIIINPSDWDDKSQCIKKPSGNIKDAQKKRLIELTDKIDNRKRLIRDLFLAQPNPETLTSDWLVDEIDKHLNPEKYIVEVEELQPETVLEYIKYFVSNADKRKDKKTSRLLSPNTKKQYVTTEKHLIAFTKHQGKTDFLFSEINEKFYNDFVDYLTQKEYTIKIKRGEEVNEIHRYTLNSVGKYIRALKVMIAGAKNADADTSSFYVFNEDVDNVYLNETELKILKDFDFSKDLHLDRVRDWFLLLAWTGSRFSDLDKIGKSDIKNNMVTYRQKKTNTAVTIPLHPVVNEILQKYKFNMPEAISNQKFNDYIKDACKLAKLDTLESFTRTVGGKLITESKPKYELVSSHTCRRSFCTNMYLRGLDTLMIRSISGHKTEKSFLKYIKVSQQQHAEMIAKKWSEIYK
ncbi:MAG: tyrosine-type recombinase/integrase [Paludibacter sp.]